jgi:hypothetical protein
MHDTDPSIVLLSLFFQPFSDFLVKGNQKYTVKNVAHLIYNNSCELKFYKYAQLMEH